MNNNDEKNKFYLLSPVIISILLHIIIFSVFFLILTDNKIHKQKTILLDFDEYVKEEKIKEKEKPVKPKEQTSQKPVQQIDTQTEELIVENNQITIPDSVAEISQVDTTRQIADSIALIDSFLVNNPDLTALRIILKERMKDDPVKKSQLDLAFEEIRKNLYKQFKDNYPIHPRHYNPGNPGGISIPIDKLLDLFR